MKFKSLILGVSAGLLLAGVSTTFGQTTNFLSLINPSFEADSPPAGSYTPSTTGWSPNPYGGNALGATINPPTPYTLQDGTNVGQMFAYGGNGGFFFLQTTPYTSIVGDTYVFSLNVNMPNSDDCRLVINLSGVAVEAQQAISTTSATDLVPYSVSWTATQAGTLEVGLWSQGMGGGTGIQFDSAVLQEINPAPVPEPGTLALAAMGGFGMLVLYRRRAA